jgi:hypothetical protein
MTQEYIKCRFPRTRKWILLGPIVAGIVAAFGFGVLAVVKHVTHTPQLGSVGAMGTCASGALLAGTMLGVALRAGMALASTERQFSRGWAALALCSIAVITGVLVFIWIGLCCFYGVMGA